MHFFYKTTAGTDICTGCGFVKADSTDFIYICLLV
jgi:hypothetical protein